MRVFSGRLMIRHKLWLGYGLILGLFALAALVAVGSLAGTQGAVRIMVQEAQPAALDALDFSSRIENASAELVGGDERRCRARDAQSVEARAERRDEHAQVVADVADDIGQSLVGDLGQCFVERLGDGSP